MILLFCGTNGSLHYGGSQSVVPIAARSADAIASALFCGSPYCCEGDLEVRQYAIISALLLLDAASDFSSMSLGAGKARPAHDCAAPLLDKGLSPLALFFWRLFRGLLLSLAPVCILSVSH